MGRYVGRNVCRLVDKSPLQSQALGSASSEKRLVQRRQRQWREGQYWHTLIERASSGIMPVPAFCLLCFKEVLGVFFKPALVLSVALAGPCQYTVIIIIIVVVKARNVLQKFSLRRLSRKSVVKGGNVPAIILFFLWPLGNT